MKNSVQILSALYKLINVPSVTDIIDGEVYQTTVPGDQAGKTNISVNLMTNSNTYLQRGYCNVNIHAPEIKDGVPDIGKLSNIATQLINILGDGRFGNYYFQVDDDKGIVQSTRDSEYIYNIKLKFQT